jgi:hypothetical protein
MAALLRYRCLRCDYQSDQTPIHKCTPAPMSAPTLEPTK